jgi:hypothetical protein
MHYNNWAIIKEFGGCKECNFLVTNTKLAKEKISLMTQEQWVSVCNRVKELEKNYIGNKHMLDSSPYNFIINFGTSNSGTDEEHQCNADG